MKPVVNFVFCVTKKKQLVVSFRHSDFSASISNVTCKHPSGKEMLILIEVWIH